jgi:hypothetical protein
MKNLFWVFFTSFAIVGLNSCETKCSQEICPGTSVNFNFRYLDSAGNDLVFGPDSIRLFSPDSIWIEAQNAEAISSFPVPLKVRQLNDTVFYLQGALSSKHTRYFLRAMDSALFIADTLQPDSTLIDSIYFKKEVMSVDTIIAGYIIENTECCSGIIKRFDLTINDSVACIECDDSQIHILVKNRDSL